MGRAQTLMEWAPAPSWFTRIEHLLEIWTKEGIDAGKMQEELLFQQPHVTARKNFGTLWALIGTAAADPKATFTCSSATTAQQIQTTMDESKSDDVEATTTVEASATMCYLTDQMAGKKKSDQKKVEEMRNVWRQVAPKSGASPLPPWPANWGARVDIKVLRKNWKQLVPVPGQPHRALFLFCLFFELYARQSLPTEESVLAGSQQGDDDEDGDQDMVADEELLFAVQEGRPRHAHVAESRRQQMIRMRDVLRSEVPLPTAQGTCHSDLHRSRGRLRRLPPRPVFSAMDNSGRDATLQFQITGKRPSRLRMDDVSRGVHGPRRGPTLRHALDFMAPALRSDPDKAWTVSVNVAAPAKRRVSVSTALSAAAEKKYHVSSPTSRSFLVRGAQACPPRLAIPCRKLGGHGARRFCCHEGRATRARLARRQQQQWQWWLHSRRCVVRIEKTCLNVWFFDSRRTESKHL